MQKSIYNNSLSRLSQTLSDDSVKITTDTKSHNRTYYGYYGSCRYLTKSYVNETKVRATSTSNFSVMYGDSVAIL